MGFLQEYRVCAQFAYEDNKCRYKIPPKYHAFCHITHTLIEQLGKVGSRELESNLPCVISPLAWNCQLDEDFVGQISTACPFAHGTNHLREQPDFSKTRLCPDFMELGHCAQGDHCKFAHGKHELRPGSSAKSRLNGRKGKVQPQEAKESKESRESRTWGLQSGYEQAALKLILKSALAGSGRGVVTGNGNKCAAQWVEWTEGKADCCDLNICTSFSRQTTCEGVETSSAQFSRCSSATSDGSIVGDPLSTAIQVAEPTTKEIDWQVRVRNTFIEIEDETIQEGCPIRKSSLAACDFAVAVRREFLVREWCMFQRNQPQSWELSKRSGEHREAAKFGWLFLKGRFYPVDDLYFRIA
eukprot:s1445_g1.t1